MKVCRTLRELRTHLKTYCQNGSTLALVPTMGALHLGHQALIQRAQELADYTCVSLFVNPKQFAPHEDFNAYPRNESKDLDFLQMLHCDLVYIPTLDSFYPPGFATTVHVERLSQGLCSDTRPTFFDGVATVVTKLFLHLRPNIALFGEKDYQQLQIIKRLVLDLDLDITIESIPIIREPDGLALSSRNAYLNPTQRNIAPQLYHILKQTTNTITQNPETHHNIQPILKNAEHALLCAGFDKIDYLQLRHTETLFLVSSYHPDQPTRLFAAVYLGTTRLIDNIPLQ